MTQQAIIPTNGNGHYGALATQDDAERVTMLTRRYKMLVANGHGLKDDEARALAQYSVATGLDAFLQECYYLPGIGPGPGIAGYRKKADEQIEYEAKRAGEPLGRWWTDYSEPSEKETGKLNLGDIAVKSTLHDSLTKTRWEQSILRAVIEGRKSGMSTAEAKEFAIELVGHEPVWTSVGIVRAAENFGGDKMNRYERACKRADKANLRKRFPRIHLPEPEGFDESLIVDSTATDVTAQPRRSEAQLMAELGFGDAPAAATVEENAAALDQVFEDEQRREAEFEDGEFHDPAELPIDPDELAFMDACEVTSASGKKFGGLKDADLEYCLAHPEKFNADQVKAAQIILDWRKSHNG